MKVAPTLGHIRVYRAVIGAVRNTKHAHPHWPINETMARSIAKRATGTLTADWPAVLAAISTPSDSGLESAVASRSPVSSSGSRRNGGRVGPTSARPASLRFIRNRIGYLAGHARRNGELDREAVLVEVLRLMAQPRWWKTRG